MAEPSPELKVLRAFLAENERSIPVGSHWAKMYRIMLDNADEHSQKQEPPLPLILSAWHYSSLLEKLVRFEQHLKWADEHGALPQVAEFLRSLPESAWAT